MDEVSRRAEVVVESSEVELRSGLRRKERFLNTAEELLERPERLEPLREADIVFAKLLSSIGNHEGRFPLIVTPPPAFPEIEPPRSVRC